MILMIDNYDSFTYNLVQELEEVGDVEIEVVRNDAAGVEELMSLKPKAVVISPGPGIPEGSGVTMEVVRAATDLPLLGICLGHQAIAAVHGGMAVLGFSVITNMNLPDDFRPARVEDIIAAAEQSAPRLQAIIRVV